MAELKQQELKKVEVEMRADQQAMENARQEMDSIDQAQLLEIEKALLDVGGLFDPSPTCDAASCALSLGTGDYWGAFWSVVSMVPYAGDAIGKSAKAVKATRKAKKLTEAMAKASETFAKAQKAINQKKVEISKKVAKDIREARAAAATKAKGKKCYGTQLPKNKGKWDEAAGNSDWISDSGYVVPYKDGHPQFGKAYKMENGKKIYAAHPDGKVEIPDMTGDDALDFAAANKAMKEKFGKEWKQPPGYTWHHGEDGATMTLVRQDIHSNAKGGVPHTGGASIVKDKEF